MHAENGVFGGSTWKWSIGDASWLANNLMDHYRYTLDKKYLEERAYPIMKETQGYYVYMQYAGQPAAVAAARSLRHFQVKPA